jgi:hypothetical protein
MGPRALSGSFTTRARRANERAKHLRPRLMALSEPLFMAHTSFLRTKHLLERRRVHARISMLSGGSTQNRTLRGSRGADLRCPGP